MSRETRKRLCLELAVLIILIMFAASVFSSKVTLGMEGSLFSDLAFRNGINTTRGYGLDLGINAEIVRLFFNKGLTVIFYPLRLVTAFFNLVFSALFLGGANYPWYYIPIIPFLCLSIGVFFDELGKNPNPFNILIAFFVFVFSSFYWGYGVYYASLVTHD